MGIKSLFWKPHLTGWRDSGLSQAAYCRQHGLSLKCFTYWRRTLGSTQGVVPAMTLPAVMPIVVAENPTSDDRIEVRLPNGLQVLLSAGLDPARLVPTIRALWSC
ncbi:MAG: IS66 family insertion sequence element accessory protein TnpB [Lysobacter sp.]|nr:IS66 family insertion sequence element accessory protein TnpB [Lysobacter sp.]